MHTRTLMVLAGLTLGATACALMPGAGRGRVVDRYPDPPPPWLNHSFSMAGDRLYAVGRALKVYSPAAQCIHMARVNAFLEMTKYARGLARDQFTRAVKGVHIGAGQEDSYLDDLATMTGDNLIMHGMVPDHQYQERIMLGHMPHPDFYYNCEVQISLPMQNYLRARAAALSTFKDNNQDAAAQALAKAADAKFNPSGS